MFHTWFDYFRPLKRRYDGEINLGEIIISYDTMKYNALNEPHVIETMNNPITDELYFLKSHGILHLHGYDHPDEKRYNEMISYQKIINENLFNDGLKSKGKK